MKGLTFARSKDALAVALRGAAEGVLDLWLVVYHQGHRAGIRPFSEGFQPTPWRCPQCRKRVVAPDDLRYATATTLRKRLANVQRTSEARDKP